MIQALTLVLLNHLISQQAWAKEVLGQHIGQSFSLDVAGVCLCFQIEEAAHLALAKTQEPDVSIQIPARALSENLGDLKSLSAQAYVRGDAQLAAVIAQLLAHLRPDIGASLSPWIGNILAHRVAQGLQLIAQSAHEGGQRLKANIVEYASQEQQLVLQKSEQKVLTTELERLSEKLTDLEKRVERFERLKSRG